MNHLNTFKLRFFCATAMAMSLFACTVEPTNSIKPTNSVNTNSSQNDYQANQQAAQPVFVSNKRVTSDCGMVKAFKPVPGFAEPLGRATRKLPPPFAASLKVGAGRELVATDTDRVSPGYVLIETLNNKQSFLINNDKEVVATFKNDYYRGYTQLLDNGHRLITSQGHTDKFVAGGEDGCAEEHDAQGKLLWRVNMNSDLYIQHHDVVKLENGNFLALIWEMSSAEEAVSQGRDPKTIPENGEFWYEGIIEVNPYTMQIVWEWSLKHHLIQDFDPSKLNYGVVADNPGLLDINKFTTSPPKNKPKADWVHLNALDYNPALDQIIMSSNYLSEVWIIDHSTTPLESIGHNGGRYGKGGDFLYRWGNPANYNRGNEADRKLFKQHDVQWVLPGLAGEGNLLIFNNGDKPRPYSTVIEFKPDMNDDGSYNLSNSAPYGPEALVWEYNPSGEEQFFSAFISGAQRLPNGNTLVNQGSGGQLREVTTTGDIVWDYAYKDEVDAPHMIFRAYRYPADHPGLIDLLSSDE